jgi:hypothetical protein
MPRPSLCVVSSPADVVILSEITCRVCASKALNCTILKEYKLADIKAASEYIKLGVRPYNVLCKGHYGQPPPTNPSGIPTSPLPDK